MMTAAAAAARGQKSWEYERVKKNKEGMYERVFLLVENNDDNNIDDGDDGDEYNKMSMVIKKKRERRYVKVWLGKLLLLLFGEVRSCVRGVYRREGRGRGKERNGTRGVKKRKKNIITGNLEDW